MRADARRNYERVVAAARDTLRESGREASLEEIARRAGVGIGTLYRRFPTRLDLLEAVYREDVDTLRVATDELVGSVSEWNAVVGWVDGFGGPHLHAAADGRHEVVASPQAVDGRLDLLRWVQRFDRVRLFIVQRVSLPFGELVIILVLDERRGDCHVDAIA